MRLNVVAVITIGCGLGVLLFIGAWPYPVEPAVPSNKLLSSASQSPELTPAALTVNDDSNPVEAAPTVASDPAFAASPTVAADPAVAATDSVASKIAAAPPAAAAADDNAPSDSIDGLSPMQPSIETPIPAVDDGQTFTSPLPTTERREKPIGAVPVLMYHYVRVNPVTSDRAGFVLSVTPHDFAQQIRFLAAHGYTTVTMAAVRDYIRTGKKLPARPIALTFDDGYDDAYSAAVPVLELYHMTATFYIVTGFVDRPRYVTWGQVIAMDRDGMEIASHTVRHSNLPILAPLARQLELTASRSTLESRLGHSILDFCYPSGQLDVATEQAVARAGYLSATTTATGFAAPGDDPLRVPRIRISGGVNLFTFAQMLGENVTANDTRIALPAAVSTTFSTRSLDTQPPLVNRVGKAS